MYRPGDKTCNPENAKYSCLTMISHCQCELWGQRRTATCIHASVFVILAQVLDLEVFDDLWRCSRGSLNPSVSPLTGSAGGHDILPLMSCSVIGNTPVTARDTNRFKTDRKTYLNVPKQARRTIRNHSVATQARGEVSLYPSVEGRPVVELMS
ncbi:hypothetical protein K474DRAFT_1670675 [Panus rudis PR-1116 ss-1]|nr:hypothetical protein K474DRAFT_1670675 [Panus rudis PR-1116 ss-1]